MTRRSDNWRCPWRAQWVRAVGVALLLAPALGLSACNEVFYVEYWTNPLRGEIVYERPGPDGQPVAVSAPIAEPVLTFGAAHERTASAQQPYDPAELLATYSWPTSGTEVGYHTSWGYSRGVHGSGARYGSGYPYGAYGAYGAGDLYGSPWIGRRVGPTFHPNTGSMGFIIGGCGSSRGTRTTRSRGIRRGR